MKKILKRATNFLTAFSMIVSLASFQTVAADASQYSSDNSNTSYIDNLDYFASDNSSNNPTLNIIHTNDIHGYYTETSKGVTGFGYLKSVIDTVNPGLVLDAGDTYHGQSFATVEKGMSIAELMSYVGYDAMTPGNHDWSYGSQILKELESAQGFLFLQPM